MVGGGGGCGWWWVLVVVSTTVLLDLDWTSWTIINAMVTVVVVYCLVVLGWTVVLIKQYNNKSIFNKNFQ